jgi:hypothetical protein
VIQAKLKLLIQTSKPGFALVNFIVDPGCGITSLPLENPYGVLILEAP